MTAPSLDPATVRMALECTMSPDRARRGQGEGAMQAWADAVPTQSGYVQLLFNVLENPTEDGGVRMAACIAIKRLIERSWPHGVDFPMNQADRAYVRATIVEATFAVAQAEARLLCAGVQTVADEDFPKQWPNVVQSVVARLGTTVANGAFTGAEAVAAATRCMQVLGALFRRYRTDEEVDADVIINELTAINEQVTMPFLVTMQAGCALLRTATQSADRAMCQAATLFLQAALDALRSDIYLDISDMYESRIGDFMACFHACLECSNPALVNTGLTELKTETVDMLTLHVARYSQEIQPFVSGVAGMVWNMLHAEPDEILVVHLLMFLDEVARSTLLSPVLAPSLGQLADAIVIPNMALQASDIERFEDDPEDYVKADMEGSDQFSRRKAVCDFVRALLQQYHAEVVPRLQGALDQLLQRHRADPVTNWRDKDTAIMLVTSLALRQTQSTGRAASLTNFVNIGEFFVNHVMPELTALNVQAADIPTCIVKASCVRFVATFRQHIPAAESLQVLGLLGSWVASPNVVVYTYAAHAIERLLHTFEAPNAPRIPSEALTLANIGPALDVLTRRLSTEKHPNEWAAMAVAALVRRTPAEIVNGMIPDMCPRMHAALVEVAKNPHNARYNHFVFESLSWLVRQASPQMAAGIEGCVWETLMSVLVQNVSELVPYTLQVVAQLLDALPPRAEGQHLPDRYAQLIGPLLSAELRTERGNIPAIVRLLTSCIRYDANAFTTGGHVEAVVDLATSLIAAKSLDHEGFNLAIAVAMHVPREASDAVLSRIFVAGMQRLQHSKTPKVERAFAVFGAVVFLCRGVEYVAGMLEGVQAGLFQLFVRRLMLLAAPRVDGLVPRRTVLNAITSLVACPQVQQMPPLFSECVLTGLKLVHFAVEAEVPEAGGSSLRRIVSTSTLPQVASMEDATRLDNLAETGGSNAFTPLTGAQRPLADPVPTITSATGHFREVTKATLAAQPPLVEALRGSLPADAFAAVCNL